MQGLIEEINRNLVANDSSAILRNTILLLEKIDLINRGQAEKVTIETLNLDNSRLAQWLCCCYFKFGKHDVFYSFEVFLPVFMFVTGRSDLDKDMDLLTKMLDIELGNLITLKQSPAAMITIDQIGANFSHLGWLLKNLWPLRENEKIIFAMRVVKDYLAANNFSTNSFWEIYYKLKSNISHQQIFLITEYFKKFAAITLSQIDEPEGEWTSDQVFEFLCEDPYRLRRIIGDREDAILKKQKYQLLHDCECRSEFRRISKINFRNLSENELVNRARNYLNKPLKIAIIGSGYLLQVAIIIAKLSNSTDMNFKKISLDLLDPIIAVEACAESFHDTVNCFINLLMDLGFDLNLHAMAQIIYEDKFYFYKLSDLNRHLKERIFFHRGDKFRGLLSIEFEANDAELDQAYTQNADLIFLNDCDLERVNLPKILEKANDGASFVCATKTNYNYGDCQVFFELTEKHGQEWKSIFKYTDPKLAASDLQKSQAILPGFALAKLNDSAAANESTASSSAKLLFKGP